MRVEDLTSIIVRLASPDRILSWSHGEVTKPETINYRTQRPEKDGLFCERIFGPEKDYECYCGKYKRIRYKGVICDRCGVEVTKSSVRRERMGHIALAVPVSHIWFLRGVPSRMGMILDIPMQQLEKVIYFVHYIVTHVHEDAKQQKLKEIDQEYKAKIRQAKTKKEMQDLEFLKDKVVQEIRSLKPLRILTELEYHEFSLRYGEIFEAGTGAETLRKIYASLDLPRMAQDLEKQLKSVAPITRRKILRRIKLLKGMYEAHIRPEWMFITILPVLPPDLRPMVQLDGGRYASSDLNDLYRRVINRNNRLKYLIEINAPEVIIRNEKRMLQEAVDALIDNSARKGQMTTSTTGGKRLLKSLADMLKGKQGRFRQNLLGKRVDYSGRSVIVIGPELHLDECGIPKKMALELFKPFVIQRIINRELAYNIRSAGKLIEQAAPEVWEILEEVTQEKFVLLNRAPTLHRLGIQAFRPVLIEGDAIRIHPLACKAFNADFDGDQMAVHIPLSHMAQREARERMVSNKNLLKPATGIPIAVPTQDMVLACFWLTRLRHPEEGLIKLFYSWEEAMYAYEYSIIDLCTTIQFPSSVFQGKVIEGSQPFVNDSHIQVVETSVGRILFNSILPKDLPFQNDEFDAKKLEQFISYIFERYGQEQTATLLDAIKDLGFEYSTHSAVSWGMDDLIVPEEKRALIQEAEAKTEEVMAQFRNGLLSYEERRKFIIEIWENAKQKISALVPRTIDPRGPVFTMVDSSARGSWNQVIQMAGMKGLVANPAGQIIELPIKSSYKEGLSVLEYFIATHGARKGAADTALRTATAGYLTRRLIDAAHEVIVREASCKDTKGMMISKKEALYSGQDFSSKIFGRILAQDLTYQDPEGKPHTFKKGTILDHETSRRITGSSIEAVYVYSPLSCKTRFGVCQRCYGWDLGYNQLVEQGAAIGIVAAQAIGEPGTQLTMRTFHTGGVAGGVDITQGLPRVNEIFEMQVPSGKAILSTVDGIVTRIEELPRGEKRIWVRAQKKKSKTPGEKESEILDGGTPNEKKERVVSHRERTEEQEVFFIVPPATAVMVEENSSIEKGQQLSEGNIDFREYFRITGSEATQSMIRATIQKIYVSQGASIHDKHIEIIIRQMASRVRVSDPGDSIFTQGDVVEYSLFEEANVKLKKDGKHLSHATKLILGISKIALTSESFLSAASFQETSRVLIRAALESRKDSLRGLKENVIIGKLIPAGSGYRRSVS